MEDKRLEHHGDILAEGLGDMGGRQVILVHLVRNKPVWNPRLVEQPGRVGLLRFPAAVFGFLAHRLQS